MIFQSRYDVGSYMSILLKNKIHNFSNTIILGILRGGSVIAQQVSMELQIPVNFLVVKNLYYEGKKIGTVLQDGSIIYNKKLIKKLEIKENELEKMRKQAFESAKNDREKFGLYKYNFSGKQVIIIDDGVKTGFTAVAAAKFAKEHGALKVVLAVPVIRDKAINGISPFFDEMIYPEKSQDINFNLQKYYMSYYSLSSDNVVEIIQKIKQSNFFLG